MNRPFDITFLNSPGQGLNHDIAAALYGALVPFAGQTLRFEERVERATAKRQHIPSDDADTAEFHMVLEDMRRALNAALAYFLISHGWRYEINSAGFEGQEAGAWFGPNGERYDVLSGGVQVPLVSGELRHRLLHFVAQGKMPRAIAEAPIRFDIKHDNTERGEVCILCSNPIGTPINFARPYIAGTWNPICPACSMCAEANIRYIEIRWTPGTQFPAGISEVLHFPVDHPAEIYVWGSLVSQQNAARIHQCAFESPEALTVTTNYSATGADLVNALRVIRESGRTDDEARRAVDANALLRMIDASHSFTRQDVGTN